MSLKLFLKSEICLIIGISSTTLSLSLVVVVLYHNYDIYTYMCGLYPSVLSSFATRTRPVFIITCIQREWVKESLSLGPKAGATPYLDFLSNFIHPPAPLSLAPALQTLTVLFNL